METITNLIKDTPIPKMVKVRQNFDKTCIPESDIPGIITRELDRPEIGGKIQPGQKIAITCGSRGINHNALRIWSWPSAALPPRASSRSSRTTASLRKPWAAL